MVRKRGGIMSRSGNLRRFFAAPVSLTMYPAPSCCVSCAAAAMMMVVVVVLVVVLVVVVVVVVVVVTQYCLGACKYSGKYWKCWRH
jgi:hypothetical protein